MTLQDAIAAAVRCADRSRTEHRVIKDHTDNYIVLLPHEVLPRGATLIGRANGGGAFEPKPAAGPPDCAAALRERRVEVCARVVYRLRDPATAAAFPDDYTMEDRAEAEQFIDMLDAYGGLSRKEPGR